MPDGLVHDPAFAEDSPYWDTRFKDEHDHRRRSCFMLALARAKMPRDEEERDDDEEEALKASELAELAMCPKLPLTLHTSAPHCRQSRSRGHCKG